MRSNEYSVRVKYVDANEDLSLSRQCRLLALNRSTVYYEPAGESKLNLELMLKIDKRLIDTPEYGSRSFADVFSMELGIDINRKRVQRLMRLMGVEAIYPKKTTSPGNASYIYPYLLRDLEITRPNQVWCADITYLPMRVTSEKWTERLKELDIQISMDGKGRWVDNVMIERFWHTLKHNDIYLKLYDSIPELGKGIYNFIERYNRFRPHTALGRKTTPDMVYSGKKVVAVKQKKKAG